jgi:hypothetical protein
MQNPVRWLRMVAVAGKSATHLLAALLEATGKDGVAPARRTARLIPGRLKIPQ